jgi:hypothetical protein
MGTFESKFKELTGVEPNFEKIALNDEAYMRKFSKQINDSMEYADEMSVIVGATDNPFMGRRRAGKDENWLRAFQEFNRFLSNFRVFEYVAARTGIMNMMGKGSMSRAKGFRILAGVTTRMMVYTVLGKYVAHFMMLAKDKALGDDDEDREIKDFDKLLGQSFASTFTTLLLGRDFGNATNSVINILVEELNKNYMGFLRDGDYDKYEDAIQYTIAPKENYYGKTELGGWLENMTGPYNPIWNTAEMAYRVGTSDDKKQADAIERQDKEKYLRLPIEVLGNLGLVPLYRDVRKLVLDDIYKDLRNGSSSKKKKPSGVPL